MSVKPAPRWCIAVVARPSSRTQPHGKLASLGRRRCTCDRVISDGAVRVVLTLDDLAELLRLAPGHRVEAATTTPDGTRAGILVMLAVAASAPDFNATYRHQPNEPIRIIRLGDYRKRMEDRARDHASPVRLVPRGTETMPEKPGIFGGDLIAAGCMGTDGINWAKWERLNPEPGRTIPWADLDAAGCVGPDGVIDWPKWERGKAPPPPPSVPPGMTPPVTKSDPPQYGAPPPYLPTRAPVTGSDAATWPKFPGEEGLPTTFGDDPGDEDIHEDTHTGGPR